MKITGMFRCRIGGRRALPDGSPLVAARRVFIRGLWLLIAITGFYSVLSLTVPVFDYIVNHRVTESRSLDTLTIAAGIALFCMCAYGILEYARAQVGLVLADRLSRLLTVPALDAVVGSGASPLAAQAVRDVIDLRNFTSGNTMATIADLLWSPFFVLVLFRLHPFYGWGTIVSGMVMLLYSAYSDRATRGRLIAVSGVVGTAIADIGATLAKAETIEGLGMTSAVTDRLLAGLDGALSRYGGIDSEAKRLAAVGSGLRNALGVGVFALGGLAVLRQEAAPVSIIIANMLMMRALSPYGSLLADIREWGFARAAWERMEKLLQDPGILRDASPRLPAEPPQAASTLIVENLSYEPEGRPDGRNVIDGVSFTLASGEILGIVGASGAGKSTLARLLVGAARPSAGRILLDGEERFGHRTGYLPQDVQLLDTGIGDNIARLRPDEASDILKAARQAGIHDLIGRLPRGYDTPVQDGGYALSGGERQRLGLARALYGGPRLLVLDEPNAHLDQKGENALIGAMKVAAKSGAIVIVISHKPALLAAATRMMVLAEGRIQQMGPRPDILPSG